jgi:hypothetical protein
VSFIRTKRFQKEKKVRRKENMNVKENDLIEVEYPIGEKKQKEVLQVIKNFNNELYVNTYVGKYKLEDFSKRDIKILSVLSYEVFNKEKEVIK